MLPLSILHFCQLWSTSQKGYLHAPSSEEPSCCCCAAAAAIKLAQQLSKIHKELKDHIKKAQSKYKANADLHRMQHPKYKEGDKVWLL